jgi:methylenetetrahydrofolate dehydrogenase (NADP+) / methenyltetrahydrofolate cyclohydrolase / formyltetrahydrofolate synthetase
MTLLAKYQIPLAGANAVIVGRSNIVGVPMSLLLLKADCTVTICHSRTKDIAKVIGEADIVVAAIGKAQFVQGSWLKPGAVVIDVGMNSIPDASRKTGKRLVGDVDFDTCSQVASYITPVPGGVGPMTIATLMSNVIALAERKFAA